MTCSWIALEAFVLSHNVSAQHIAMVLFRKVDTHRLISFAWHHFSYTVFDTITIKLRFFFSEIRLCDINGVYSKANELDSFTLD